MRRIRWTLALAVALATAAASHAGRTEPAREQPGGDELAIRQLIANWDQGWKVFDAELATRDYSADADWTNAFGLSRKGRAEIHKFLENFYTAPGTRSRTSTPSTTTIRFIRPDIAAATSYRETVGQKTASGAEYPKRKTHDLRLLTREKGKWSIVSHLIMDEKETRP